MIKKHLAATLAMSAVTVLSLVGSSSSAFAASSTSHIKRVVQSSIPLEIVPSPNGNFQDNFSPFSPNMNYGTEGFIYEPLFYFDNVSGKTFSLLGTTYSWSNGNKTLTVNLRHASWSDGKSFTSADVVFTFDLLKKYPAADITGQWAQLNSVKADGLYKVVFQFKQPNVPFASYTLNQFIVPKHIWANLGDPTKVNVTKPIGTGPYTLQMFSTQDYKYGANNHYWGGIPPVKTLDFPAYSGNDAGDMALASGKVDWAGMFIPNIQNLFVNKDAQHNHYFFPPGNIVMLYTNLKDPLLSQLPVREAMSLAIDRSKLANEGEYGYAKVANPLGLVLPNNQAWIDPALKSQLTYQYNPAKAIKILEAAGFKKDAQGIFEKGGKKLSFTLQVPAGWTDWDTDCGLIEQNFKAVGIAVTVNQESTGAYNNNLNSPGGKKSYQLAMSWTNPGPTPYFLYQNLLSNTGNYNVEQLSNASINAALNAFAKTSVLSKQKQDLYMIEKYMATQMPSLPLFYGPVWFEYRTANYTGFPTQANPWINPAPWTNYAQAIVVMHLHPTK